MTCEITTKVSSKPVRELINKYIIPFTDFNVYKMNKDDFIKVFINGEWIGFTVYHKKNYSRF